MSVDFFVVSTDVKDSNITFPVASLKYNISDSVCGLNVINISDEEYSTYFKAAQDNDRVDLQESNDSYNEHVGAPAEEMCPKKVRELDEEVMDGQLLERGVFQSKVK